MVRRIPVEKPQDGYSAKATQDGTATTVRVTSKCQVWTTDEIEIAHVTDHENQTPASTWANAAAGAAFLGAGVATLADASNVYPSDPHSRTYNRYGSGGATGWGVIFLGTGAVFAGLAALDVYRANSTDTRLETVKKPASSPSGECEGPGVKGLKVTAVAAGKPVELGTTDSRGVVTVDLRQTPWAATACGETSNLGVDAAIQVGDASLGKIPLAPLYQAMKSARRSEDASFAKAAKAGLSQCAKSGACAPVERYVKGPVCLPDAEFHKEAAEALDEGQWVKAKAKQCETGTTAAACDGVANYVRGGGDHGKHADEANDLLLLRAYLQADSACAKDVTGCLSGLTDALMPVLQSSRFKSRHISFGTQLMNRWEKAAGVVCQNKSAAVQAAAFGLAGANAEDCLKHVKAAIDQMKLLDANGALPVDWKTRGSRLVALVKVGRDNAIAAKRQVEQARAEEEAFWRSDEGRCRKCEQADNECRRRHSDGGSDYCEELKLRCQASVPGCHW